MEVTNQSSNRSDLIRIVSGSCHAAVDTVAAPAHTCAVRHRHFDRNRMTDGLWIGLTASRSQRSRPLIGYVRSIGGLPTRNLRRVMAPSPGHRHPITDVRLRSAQSELKKSVPSTLLVRLSGVQCSCLPASLRHLGSHSQTLTHQIR